MQSAWWIVPFAVALGRCYQTVSFVLVRHIYAAADRVFGSSSKLSRKASEPNTIVTDLPLKVFLLCPAFGPIVPYQQDRAKLTP